MVWKMCSSTLLLCFALMSFAVNAANVAYDGRGITIDGERKILISGSIHYPRSTAEMWPDLIKKGKEGGLNVIETYVFWNAHEPERHKYDFSGNLDLVRFIKTIKAEGLYSLLRIGPYVCAEWLYGGFPVWLHNLPGIKIRTHNPVFENEMKSFTTLIVEMLKREKLFASQGGPIISAQIENEYGDVMSAYGNEGIEYLNWCAQLAESYNIGVPWIMCQQNNAPKPLINTCNGWYCDQFHPNSNSTPKIWTENWAGWYKNWGGQKPHRTAEDLAFAVARFYQFGGTFQNYYMYHGGTNFGRSAGGPYIATSYDYDAPLDEYGNLNQPKWGHIKRLHQLLRAHEKTLTYGFSRTDDYGNMVTVTSYEYQGKSVCFLGNANSTNDATINFRNTMYTVPAWSVSFLSDCYKEDYNTAKVNAQTSVMVHKDNGAFDQKEKVTLKWQWRREPFDQPQNNQIMAANELLDYKVVTNGTSDYLWYITSFDMKGNDPILSIKSQDIKLRVNTSGHVVHAFVNGAHVGSQYAENGQYQFVFERKIQLTSGKNDLVLLSTIVGLTNYGSFFDNVDVGIHGPVQLVAQSGVEEVIADLSKNKWVYKVGLQGERQGLWNPHKLEDGNWLSAQLPTNKSLVWLKATFKAPLGKEPVVVDLKGLGKGYAWVNGNNIGRYWPSYLASENGCTSNCDYRGAYSSGKCLTECGKPTQTKYHVPRSFLKAENNTLVLFEELGGNPYSVKFQTVTVGKACGHAHEGRRLDLACQGHSVFSQIKFASFGQPMGQCGSFEKGKCESSKALQTIKALCLGKKKCSIPVSENVLGSTGCKGENWLAVEALC